MTRQHKTTQFGELEPQYHLALNPYPDMRFSSCPSCSGKTGQRKLPLLLHVDPRELIALNYTCRFCPACDLLVVHQHEIEEYLTQMFSERDPSVIGNPYLIIGTVERSAWRQSMKRPMNVAQTRAHTRDLRSATTIQMSMGGWFPQGVEPPLRPPVRSQRWVKR